MKTPTLFLTLGLVCASLALLVVPPPAAAQIAPTRLEVTVGVDPEGKLFFTPDEILVPQVNITLNVTFVNNYSDPGMGHSFTISDSDENLVINTGVIAPNVTVSVEFHIVDMTNISYNGSFFEPQALGQGIRFFCIPHAPGMEGTILLATRAAEEPEKGILLRAYWIGIIGIGVTLGWIGISYFVIKSSSRHFSDHREHVRKGLP